MIRACYRLFRRARNFVARWTLRGLSFARILHPRLQLEWLIWLRDDMRATDPNLPEVLRDIAARQPVRRSAEPSRIPAAVVGAVLALTCAYCFALPAIRHLFNP